MPEDSDKLTSLLTPRQLIAAIAALTLHAGINGAIPLLGQHETNDATEKAVERIADELAHIRGSLVTTQIEMTKALATTMQELSDHSRRLERLEQTN